MEPEYNTPIPYKKAAKLWKVNYRDLIHGFIVTALTTTVTGLSQLFYEGISDGSFHIPTSDQVRFHVFVGIMGGIGYLLKKFSTNSQGKVLKSE